MSGGPNRLPAGDETAKILADERDDEQDDGGGHEWHQHEAALPHLPAGGERHQDIEIEGDYRVDSQRHDQCGAKLGGEGGLHLNAPSKRDVPLYIKRHVSFKCFLSGILWYILCP